MATTTYKTPVARTINSKIIDLGDGTDLHVHFANNKGRGNNNVTLTRVPHGALRPAYTREYGDDVISQTTTSGWRGRVNFSKRVREDL